MTLTIMIIMTITITIITITIIIIITKIIIITTMAIDNYDVFQIAAISYFHAIIIKTFFTPVLLLFLLFEQNV